MTTFGTQPPDDLVTDAEMNGRGGPPRNPPPAPPGEPTSDPPDPPEGGDGVLTIDEVRARGRQIAARVRSGIAPDTNTRVALYDMPRVLAGVICRHLRDNGGSVFRAQGSCYLYDPWVSRTLRISANDPEFCSQLAYRYTLSKHEGLTRGVIDQLMAAAIYEGGEREVHRFSAKVGENLYLSRYDGRAWQISPDGAIESVNNGANMLFVDDDGGQPCDAEIGEHGELLQSLVGDLQYSTLTPGGITPEQQQCLLAIWMFCLPLSHVLPAKPILLIDGQRGAGKTASLQRIQAAVHGRVFGQVISKKREDDFATSLIRHPIALVDNVDGWIEWLRDLLCAYVTGAGWSRRRLYSDADEVLIQPMAFIAIASKNPKTFKRDDIADRAIILHLDRREKLNGYTPMGSLLGAVKEHRPRLMGEYLYYLARIYRELPRMTDEVQAFRLADFARLAYVIGPILGFSAETVTGALAAANAEREAFMTAGDQFLALIGVWVSNGNEGRVVPLIELFRELSTLSETYSMKMGIRSTQDLAAKLRSEEAQTKFEVSSVGDISNPMICINKAIKIVD